MWPETANWRTLVVVLALLILAFLATIWISFHPDLLDRPLARFLNQSTGFREPAGEVAFGLADPTWEGLAMTGLVWYCWFTDLAPEMRARLVTGICASVLAGGLAHVLHRTLPFRPRPLFDTLLNFQPARILGDIDALGAVSSAGSSSFPSERATMFAGIAVSIFIARPWLGVLAAISAGLPELGRLYLGLHYPGDILGSISLAAAAVCVAQFGWGVDIGRWILAWERASAPIFYAGAFLFSYQIATAFDSVRAVIRVVSVMIGER